MEILLLKLEFVMSSCDNIFLTSLKLSSSSSRSGLHGYSDGRKRSGSRKWVKREVEKMLNENFGSLWVTVQPQMNFFSLSLVQF